MIDSIETYLVNKRLVREEKEEKDSDRKWSKHKTKQTKNNKKLANACLDLEVLVIPRSVKSSLYCIRRVLVCMEQKYF